MSDSSQPLGGSGAAEPAPAGSQPAVTEPVVTEPAGTEPMVTKPAVTDLAVTDLAVTEAAATESAGTGPVELAAPVGDVIESPPRSRRPLAVVLTTVAVVLAVLVGGGAFALVRMWNGPVGTLPEELVPGSVAAFARIDLAPGIGQRVKVEALLRKAGGNGPKSLDATKHDVFADLGAPIGYDDVASWFDDRAGVAMWADPDHADRAVMLVVLSSRDDGKARKALAAAQRKAGTDKIGFVAGDGRVLLAFGGKDLQRVAAAAAAAAAKTPLSKEPAFTSAVAKLPAGQPGLAWADLSRAAVLEQAFIATMVQDEGMDPEDLPAGLPADPGVLPGVKGTLVVGVQAGDDGIEVRARLSGAAGLPLTGTSTGTDALALLGALPGDATAAGVAGGPLGDVSALGEPGILLSSALFPLAIFSGPGLGEGLEGDLDPDDLPPGAEVYGGVTLPPGVDPGDLDAVKKYFQEHPEALTGGAGTGTMAPGVPKVNPEALQKSTEALAKAVTAATSVSFTVAGAAGPEDELGGPIQVDLRLADTAAAKRLQTDLAELLKVGGTVCEVHEEHVVLRTKTYAAGSAGKLADSARFRAATAGGVPGATAAFYLDGDRSDSAPAKAIGVTVGHDGADTVIMARILIG